MTNPNYYNIKNKTILITGAAGLIGSSLAKEASDLGADYLVIGRPITSSENIRESLTEIYQSIQ